LQWSFDALTVQTEADELINVYVRCVPPGHAGPFLAEILTKTEAPSVRVHLLDGLARTGHKVAIDALVEHVASSDIYLILESTQPGDDKSYTVGDAASRLLAGMFPDVEMPSPESWIKWWAVNRDGYTPVRGLPSN